MNSSLSVFNICLIISYTYTSTCFCILCAKCILLYVSVSYVLYILLHIPVSNVQCEYSYIFLYPMSYMSYMYTPTCFCILYPTCILLHVSLSFILYVYSCFSILCPICTLPHVSLSYVLYVYSCFSILCSICILLFLYPVSYMYTPTCFSILFLICILLFL